MTKHERVPHVLHLPYYCSCGFSGNFRQVGSHIGMAGRFKINLRLPEDVENNIIEEAGNNGWSVNKEILEMLKKVYN